MLAIKYGLPTAEVFGNTIRYVPNKTGIGGDIIDSSLEGENVMYGKR